MVSCYAPQAGRSQIEKKEFWRQVEGVIMTTDINQEVIIGGDMKKKWPCRSGSQWIS